MNDVFNRVGSFADRMVYTTEKPPENPGIVIRREIRGARTATRISQSSSSIVGCGGACGFGHTRTDRYG